MKLTEAISILETLIASKDRYLKEHGIDLESKNYAVWWKLGGKAFDAIETILETVKGDAV